MCECFWLFFSRHFQRVQTRAKVVTFLWKLMTNNFLQTLNFRDIHTVYGAFWWKDLLHENISTVTSNYVFTAAHICWRHCPGHDRRSGREWFSLQLGANFKLLMFLLKISGFGKPWSKASLHLTLMVLNNCFHNSLRWKKILSINTFTTKCG